jgi:hypothetical protein
MVHGNAWQAAPKPVPLVSYHHAVIYGLRSHHFGHGFAEQRTMLLTFGCNLPEFHRRASNGDNLIFGAPAAMSRQRVGRMLAPNSSRAAPGADRHRDLDRRCGTSSLPTRATIEARPMQPSRLQLAARGDPLRRVGALRRQYDGRNSNRAGPGAQRSAGRCSRPYRRPLSRTLRCQIAVSAATRRPCNRW